MSAELERLLRERRECNARLIVDQLRSAELKHAISAMHERNRQAEASRRIAAEEARIAKSKYPARGSKGWTYHGDGDVWSLCWNDSDVCRLRFDSGNWYATEREAIVARDAWLAFNKLRKAGLRLKRQLGCVSTFGDPEASCKAWDALPPEQRAALEGEA